MPLDSQFCTFTFSQLDQDASKVAVAESGRRDPVYCRTKYRHDSAYMISLDDPYCPGKFFGEIQAPGGGTLRDHKQLTLVLHDPHDIILLSTSPHAMRFVWSFTYANHLFRLRKESGMSHGPGNLVVEWMPPRGSDDPPIQVAQYTLHKKGNTTLTMLDHNIARLRVSDVKGLEVCIILSFFWVLDLWAAEGLAYPLMMESERLKAFKNPTLELMEKQKEREEEAAQQYHGRTMHQKLGRLFRRHTKGDHPDKKEALATRALACH